jgi:RNA polymerase sigma-70 factor (ECF subfamily)
MPQHHQTSPDWDLAADATPAAFGELYRRHHLTVYRYIRSRIHHHESAEDLTNDVFLRAYKNPGHNTGHEYRAWLFTIARNIILDHHRRNTRRPETLVDSIPEPRPSGERTHTDAIDDAHTAQQLLHATFINLNPRHQAILADRYLHDLEPHEIAARNNETRGAIKTLQQRALRTLRKQLQDVTG